MNKRMVVRLLLLAIVVAIVVWIARNTYWDEITVPLPLKGEAARNPFYGAQKFVAAVGARSEWDRFQKELPTDAVIILSSWHWDLAEGRRSRMEKWVEAGGRLVLDDTIVGADEQFESWSGISHRFLGKESDDEDDEDEEPAEKKEDAEELVKPGLRDCRMLRETMRATGSRAGAAANFQLCSSEGHTSLVTTRRIAWALSDDSGNQVLRTNVGKGSVTVINAAPFQYRGILRGDHAALLLAAAQIRHGDDVHFLSEQDHASLLTLAWLLGWPVVLLFLAFVVLALWRSGVRFGPLTAEPDLARRSLAEQIRGTGQFAMRLGGGKALHAAALRALYEAAQKRAVNFNQLSADERVDVIARLTGIEATTLAPALHYAGSRRSQELRSAIALIESARRRILIKRNLIEKGSAHGN